MPTPEEKDLNIPAIVVERKKKGSAAVLETFSYQVNTWASAMSKAKKDYIKNHPVGPQVGMEEIAQFTFTKKKEAK